MIAEALPAELEAVRLRLRAFLHEELLPAEREHGLREEADAPPALRRWVRTRSDARGLFRQLQPADLGGGGLGPLGQVALHEEIAAAGSVLGRFALGGDGGLLRHGTADQRRRFLAPVLSGELAAAFAFTDPPEGPRTTAVRRGDGFVLTGVKAFVTDGPRADLLLTVARVTENTGGLTGTGLFVLRREAPGVRLSRELRTLDGGLHGEFALEEALVPQADVLGEIGQGLPRALESITALRLRAAAHACGTGRWALDYTLSQTARPHRSGTPLREREQVQAMIADSATDLFAARSALYACARMAESGGDVEIEVAMAKTLATEAVARIVDRAMQLTGGASVVEGHPLARLYRVIRAWRIAEGTTEVLRLVVARGLVKKSCPEDGTGTPSTGR
ncbi:MAG: acyl-CoA dehydrogenase family protein [Candidatus Rokubacteria bacterium]|nr:acyl-CoA dehydrogenase family protein [Candidatus Rokubacteria bacterium]